MWPCSIDIAEKGVFIGFRKGEWCLHHGMADALVRDVTAITIQSNE